jgi:hypothetical protein
MLPQLAVLPITCAQATARRALEKASIDPSPCVWTTVPPCAEVEGSTGGSSSVARRARLARLTRMVEPNPHGYWGRNGRGRYRTSDLQLCEEGAAGDSRRDSRAFCESTASGSWPTSIRAPRSARAPSASRTLSGSSIRTAGTGLCRRGRVRLVWPRRDPYGVAEVVDLCATQSWPKRHGNRSRSQVDHRRRIRLKPAWLRPFVVVRHRACLLLNQLDKLGVTGSGPVPPIHSLVRTTTKKPANARVVGGALRSIFEGNWGSNSVSRSAGLCHPRLCGPTWSPTLGRP